MTQTCAPRTDTRRGPGSRSGSAGTGGFSVIEIIIALIVLTVGVLGFAGTTALVTRQVTVSDVSTQRAAALQSVVERLRATSYPDLSAGTETVGNFTVRWTVEEQGTSKLVTLVTVGPGLQTGNGGLPGVSPTAADTLEYRILQP